MLNFENITNQTYIETCEQKISQIIPKILPDIIIDDESLEDISGNEAAYEGVALYKGKRYYIFLDAYDTRDFQYQAAACVAEALVTKSRFLILVS